MRRGKPYRASYEVLRLLMQKGELTVPEIADALDRDERGIRTTLRTLRLNGLIKVIGRRPGRSGRVLFDLAFGDRDFPGSDRPTLYRKPSKAPKYPLIPAVSSAL